MAKRKQADDVVIEPIQEVVNTESSLPSFINPKMIGIALGGLALAFTAWFAYKEFVAKPKQAEAVASMWKAQQYFDQDSFQLALVSPSGDYEGFEAIADNFGSTPSGNSAKYYAGVSNLQLGQIDKAISYLEDYSPADNLLGIMKHGALGDCYSEKNELEKALGQYASAVSAGDNELLTSYYLKKAGMLSEYLNKPAEAAKYYQQIKSKYPASPVGSDIDKFLARVGIVD
jgi:tetratricopeptide (TPR) repeat protein